MRFFCRTRGSWPTSISVCWRNWGWSMKRDNTRKNVFSPRIWWWKVRVSRINYRWSWGWGKKESRWFPRLSSRGDTRTRRCIVLREVMGRRQRPCCCIIYWRKLGMTWDWPETWGIVWRHKWLTIYTGFTWWSCQVSSWTECSSFVVTRPYWQILHRITWIGMTINLRITRIQSSGYWIICGRRICLYMVMIVKWCEREWNGEMSYRRLSGLLTRIV